MAKRDSDTRKRLDSVAETVGTSLGLLLNQIEDQVHVAGERRDTAVKRLLAIRDKTTQLLADLGHSITEMPLPGRKRTPARPKQSEGSAAPPSVRRTAAPTKKRPATMADTRASAAEPARARSAKLRTAKKSGK